MKTFLQISFFLFLVTKLSYSQWYLQNSGTTETLHSVTFIDSINGFAVGRNGIILRTTNGGINWDLQPSGVSGYLFGVSFTDAKNGWVVGDGYIVGGDTTIIIHTTDGGQSWISQSNPTPYAGLYDVSFIEVNYIEVNYGWAVGGNGVILRTTNGGATWVQQISNTDQILKGICFIDINFGTVVGDRYFILHTKDGGQNWINQFPAGSLFSLYGVSFTDTNNGWAVGDQNILKTTNGGTDWIEQTMGATHDFRSVCFTDTSTGVAVGYEVILRTTNGGTDWIEQTGVPANRWLHDVFFFNENIGWAVGDSGLILHTTNGGVAFVEEKEINRVPTEYNLSNNFPNPFNPSTKIKYTIPNVETRHASSLQMVTLKIYDVLGNEIETLVNEEKPAGTYQVTWYAANLPSGVYFYQLKAGSFIQTRKMILLK